MPDIFISYKYEERDTAGRLAERLTELGFDVWWDAALLAGARFEDEIRTMLASSKVAIVLWSRQSVTSDWVKAEAEIARKRGIVLPAVIDDVAIEDIPLLFQNMHTADMRGWAGDPEHAGFREIAAAVRARVGAPAGPSLTQQQAEERLAEGASEAEVWAAITQNSEQNAAEYRRYLERYGDTARFSELAALRIRNLEEGERRKRWNWAQIGTLIAGVGALIGSLVAVAQFVQANPAMLGFMSGWGISEEQRLAISRCESWALSGNVDAVSGLPRLDSRSIRDCETAASASPDYTGHLALVRLAQGPNQGDESVRLASDGASRDLPFAIYTQAVMYEKGYELHKNLQRAADLYWRASDLGLIPAQAALCRLFLDGIVGWELPVTGPLQFCDPAAEAGNAVAQHALGLAYESGAWGLLPDRAKALELYQASADQQNSIGQWRLGLLYRDGRGVDVDHARALALFRAASEQQDPTAHRLVGMMFELGWGVEQNFQSAGVLYEQAVSGSDSIAWQLLAYDPTSDGMGYVRNFPEDYDLGRLMADPSSAIARRLRAYDFYSGVRGPRNEAEAFELYSEGAAEEDPFAQRILGFLHQIGSGTTPDPDKAFEFYSRSADTGILQGQFQLGFAYENGIGTAKDLDRAAHYYRLAAAQGSEPASQQLQQLQN